MPANAPNQNEMLHLDEDEQTLEVDMRWALTDKPELKKLMESACKPEYEASIDYDDPALGSVLTETQVFELLNEGKK